MRRVVKPIEQDKKYLLLCSHLKFKYSNCCEIFLQRNQSDFFLESRGHYTKIKKFLQNGRPTVLRSLREDIPQYILKSRVIELQTSFRLLQFFAGTLRKWRLIFLPRNCSLTKNSVNDRWKVWMEIRLKDDRAFSLLHQELPQNLVLCLLVPVVKILKKIGVTGKIWEKAGVKLLRDLTEKVSILVLWQLPTSGFC